MATIAPAVAGPMMRLPMNASCISALAASSPLIGTADRIVTVCAGPKKADTQLSEPITR